MSVDEVMVRAAFAPYRDKNGLIQNSPYPIGDNASGNGLLYTAQYYCLLKRLGYLTNQDRGEFSRAIDACWVEPGLLKRSVTHGDQEGPDDYVGVCTASWMLGTDHAAKILAHGKRTGWWYNNVQPGSHYHPDGRVNTSAYLGRMRQVVCHFYWCAGETAPIHHRTVAAVTFPYSILFNADDTNTWTLSWMLVQPTGGWLEKPARSLFYSRLRSNYPGGMKEVYAKYFQQNQHPCALYWVD